MKRRTATTIYDRQRTWFFAACGILLVVCALYMYFVCVSVVHVVMRKEIDQKIADTNSYVSQLEAQYIDAQQEVNTEIATHQGYVTTDKKIFINRAPTSLSLSNSNGT